MHVEENEVLAFVGGGMPADQVSLVRAHLDSCPDCVALVACAIQQRSAAPVEPSWPTGSAARELGEAPTLDPAPRRRQPILTAGANVGPYVAERLLGAGGMGVVYAAHDPRLDRTVALKLIRPELGLHRDKIVERMRRESKALARLSHPNVTVVYDLGASGDDIYVAMEYVDGANLRAWRQNGPRSVREIIATFSSAGRGLAAAHAAGVVHRDFKPDNVLLGNDGSVKVTDFGLARLAGETLDAASPGARLRVSALEGELTATGMLLGTPAYMAPEQFLAGDVDARADQFAFCVALYEALYGERPFLGRNVDELRQAILAGHVALPRVAGVPGRVRRAMRRGLAVDPDRRFPSMDALLSEIAPRNGRWTLAAGGLAVATSAALIVNVLSSASQPKPCGGTPGEVAAVWNAGRKDTLRQAFGAAHVPGAEQTWADMQRGIDAYTASWATMHRGACEATRVQREASEAVLDLRIACLERRRSELDALLGVFAHADTDVVVHAREAVSGLVDVSTCADVDGLRRRRMLPADPAARRSYDTLRSRIDHARALVEVAHYKDAAAAIAEILGGPGGSAFPGLEADALLLRARVLTQTGAYADAESALFRALVRAQAARADETVAAAAVDLASVVGYREERAADGERWAEFAASAIAAKGGDDLLVARLDGIRGAIFQRAGRFADAEQAFHKGLELATRKAPGTVVEAELLDGLGSILGEQGRFDEALPRLRKALLTREHEYGPIHTLTVSTRMNLANVLGTMRHYDEALELYHQVVAADETLYGPDGMELSMALSNLGQMLQSEGRSADARPVLERALAIREKVLGPKHPRVARALVNLGYLLVDEHRHEDALADFERADAIVVEALGADHAARVEVLEGIGAAWLGLGLPGKALAPLERALAVRTKNPADPVELASLQADLARVLWVTRRDRARAEKLADAARPVLAAAGETRVVAEIDAWRDRHPAAPRAAGMTP